ncbi:hypothetical protein [Treponema sp.]|uniref:hypothetical protein n=1 Tax=Treponema sp. TaxID=166 RepID=UPI0025DCE8BB|nr:hypothetical protein [Treponema sp.]MBR4322452.1 hypothetical protein [Treponema sp.]
MLQENSFEIIHLFELLSMEGGESLFKEMADSFSSINKDVEIFFKEKAVQSCKLNTSSTYIIVSTNRNLEVLGYFTLATKMLTIKLSTLSKSEQKTINRYGYYDEDSDSLKIPAILIAQLSRNFSSKIILSGSDLMDIILKQVKSILNLTSGKTVFLECEKIKNLTDFYESQHFKFLDTKLLSRDSKELIQMYRLI